MGVVLAIIFFLLAGLLMGAKVSPVIAFLLSAAIIVGMFLLLLLFQKISKDAKQASYERQSRIEGEKRVRDQLNNMLANAKQLALKTPELIAQAELSLDKAEEEFAASTFAPFWDQVENATNALAGYHQNICIIAQTADQYKTQLGIMNETIQPFPVSLGKLPDARHTASRLSGIVRRAQQNFQFATIYEQRKTNALLYQGFRSLGEAIYSIGSRIDSSLQNLSEQLHVSMNDLIEQSREDAADRRRYEEESLRVQRKQDHKLDDIQRGRKPLV